MVVMATTAMAQIDVTKTYRIKDVASGNYLTAFNHDAHSEGAVGGVGVAELDENSKEQVFYLEPTSAGYFLRLSSGDYYVIGQGWNVDALAQNGTIFNFEDAGEGNFYLKKESTYFKTQTVSDITYVFCDAPEDLKATWELEVVGESGYATYNTFNANKAYVIKSRERGGLTINEEATGFCSTNDAGRGTFVEHANTDNHFAVVTYEEKSYLYSVEAKKFLKADLTLTGGIGDVVAFRDASAEGASRMSIYFKEVTDANINIGGSNQIQVNWWSSIDHGNAMLFVEVADFDPAEALAVLSDVAEVTYNFVYEGVTVGTQTTTIEKGAAYPAIDVTKFPFGFTATTPTGTVDTDTEKTIELTATFSWADSYENITAWYYLDLKDGKYLFYEEGQTNIPLTKTEVDSNNKDAYTWGFIGDPVNGFQIVNYAAGSSMILSSTTNTFDGNTGGSTYPVMTTTPVPDGNNTLWIFTASTYRENGFYIGQKDANNGANKLNNRDDKLAYWNGGADLGSTFIMTERPMGAVAELEALVEEVNAVKETYLNAVGTEVGYLTEASVNNVAAALTAAEELLAGAPTAEQATEAQNNLKAAIAAIATVQPTEGVFYNIVSSCTKDHRAGQMIYVNDEGGMQFARNSDETGLALAKGSLGQVVQFVPAGDDLFYVYFVARDTYMSTALAHNSGQEKALAATAEDAVKVAITNMGSENIVKIVPVGGGMIHAQDAGSKVVAWDNEAYNDGSAWKISEVEDPTLASFDLTIGEAGYSTLYLGCAVTVPAGVKAYPVTVNGEWAVFGEALATIPANTGVIIAGENGEAATAGTYKFNYAAPVDAIDGNELNGSTINTYVEGAAYVLANGENGVGFYKTILNKNAAGGEADTHFLNNANKAYLEVPAAEGVACYSFRFGEGTTGVEEITDNREQSTVIYDLTGRRVEAITAPGIYVVNGNKVLVK